MKRTTKRRIKRVSSFAALSLLGPLGGAIHAEKWPNERLWSGEPYGPFGKQRPECRGSKPMGQEA